MKTIEQRKLKLEVMEEAIEALERIQNNSYNWQREYMGFNDANIDEWDNDKKAEYEKLIYKEAVLQSFINYIENIKV